MILADISFGSKMLANEGKALLEEILSSKKHEEIHQAMALLWSLRNLLDDHDRRQKVDGILDLLSGPIQHSVETEAVILKILELLDEDDKDAIKTIRRRFRKLAKAEPQALKRLFPPRTPGRTVA